MVKTDKRETTRDDRPRLPVVQRCESCGGVIDLLTLRCRCVRD